MNTCSITGYITSELELKSTNNGIKVVAFPVAVRRPNVKDQTDFIDCVAWRERAEFICKYFKKGSRIEITGHIETRLATLKDNSKRKFVELYCETVGFGERNNKEESTEEAPATAKEKEPEKTYQEQTAGVQFQTVGASSDNSDDLPF